MSKLQQILFELPKEISNKFQYAIVEFNDDLKDQIETLIPVLHNSPLDFGGGYIEDETTCIYFLIKELIPESERALLTLNKKGYLIYPNLLLPTLGEVSTAEEHRWALTDTIELMVEDFSENSKKPDWFFQLIFDLDEEDIKSPLIRFKEI